MPRLRTLIGFLVVLVVIALVVASGIIPRLRARQALEKQTDLSAEPTVSVIHPQRGAPSEEVILPGNVQAFLDAPLYARTNGYLKRWYFDIGAHVKQGQLLAEIESPEVDQQLQQGRADLTTAQANLKLSQITAGRYSELFKTDSIAKQDVDNAVQDEAAKESTVKSAQANVRRLEQMVAFEKIYAPFDGVITSRNTDVGQLIDAGSSNSAGASGSPGLAAGQTRELFRIAAVNKLRVFVNVPQIYSHAAVPGMKADLTLPELAGRRFQGTLARTADSMDPATRTLLVEVDVVNSTGLLFPGAYAEVHFSIKAKGSTLIIPTTSLIFRSDGVRVPTVGNDNHAALLPVTLGRDFGTTVEVVSGLRDDAVLIADPPDSLVEGEVVRVVNPKLAAPKPVQRQPVKSGPAKAAAE